MNNKLFLIISLLVVLITGCAGLNPNPGERTTDMAWTSSNFQRAYEIAKPKAEEGEPWAQLRMGIFYENGWGTKKDIERAEYWYKQVMAQKSSGGWAEGKIVGATGRLGYFNQNNDARIAAYNLAQLYYNNDMNLIEANKLINDVILETNGKAIFFCCEFSGGRYFTQGQLLDLKHKIETKLSSV